MVLPNRAIGCLQSTGHKPEANEPLLSNIARRGTLQWHFCAKKIENGSCWDEVAFEY